MYKLNLSPTKLKSLGFRYDAIAESYSYEFPVYKHNNQIVITCKLWVNNDTKELTYIVQNRDKEVYAAYYNREFGGINHVVLAIDENIKPDIY